MRSNRMLRRDVSQVFTVGLLLLSMIAPAELLAVGFANPANYRVGNSPLGAAVGDFNGDGKKDLAVANSASGTVSVLLGKGGGAFQPAANYHAGKSPTFVAVADLDGDHNLDLAVANGSGGTISILLGNGDGTFQPPVRYGAGGVASFVTVADFNRDGRPDLLVSNTNGMISVLLGRGDGSFHTPIVTVTQGNTPIVAVGDFNRDGHVDVATAHASTNIERIGGSLLVMLGNGNGTFQSAATFEISDLFRAPAIAAANFNHDGKTDLAIAAETGTFIMLGNGDGTFTLAPNPRNLIHGPYGFAAVALSIADPNHDGNPDLVTINADFGFQPFKYVIEWGLGTGNGTFGGELVNDNPCTQSTGCILLPDVPGSLVVADLNGDNAPDLVITNQNVIYTSIPANNVSVYLNRAGTLVKLTSSVNPSLVGKAVTFTCALTAGVSGSGTPTGTVTFKDGTVTLGTVTLVSAKAALTRSNLSAGQHFIKAFYSGDSKFNRNTSSTLKQVVQYHAVKKGQMVQIETICWREKHISFGFVREQGQLR